MNTDNPVSKTPTSARQIAMQVMTARRHARLLPVPRDGETVNEVQLRVMLAEADEALQRIIDLPESTVAAETPAIEPKAEDMRELRRLRAQDRWWRASFQNLLACGGKRQALLDTLEGMQQGLPEPEASKSDPLETEVVRLNLLVEQMARNAVVADDAILRLVAACEERTAVNVGIGEDERRGMIWGAKAARAYSKAVADAAFPGEGYNWVDAQGNVVRVVSVMVSDPFVWTDRGPIPFTVFLRTFKPVGSE